MTAPLTVCVYCSSSDDAAPALHRLAADVGAGIAARGWALVYGGGDIGLMGELAHAALAGGAHVTGVIPHKLVDRELALPDCDELIRTDTMRQRKQEMDHRADAFVVLPGGIGTLEELLEVWTLRQLGYHDRPIVLVDPDGFWAPLRQQIDELVARGMAAPGVAYLVSVVADAQAALAAVAAEAGAEAEVG